MAPITGARPEQRIGCFVGVSRVIPALRHFERLRFALAADAIDQPMFAIDPAGPPAAQVPAKWLGLARSAKGIAAGIP